MFRNFKEERASSNAFVYGRPRKTWIDARKGREN